MIQYTIVSGPHLNPLMHNVSNGEKHLKNLAANASVSDHIGIVCTKGLITNYHTLKLLCTQKIVYTISNVNWWSLSRSYSRQ